MNAPQPKTIANPLWCEVCEGRGYVVFDSEWNPYAVQCAACLDRRRDKELSWLIEQVRNWQSEDGK